LLPLISRVLRCWVVRILLDEQLPVDLAAALEGHNVDTVAGRGWTGVTNGELLRRMGGEYDALVTMDRGIEFQQNLTTLSVGVLLIRASSNRMAHLQPLVPAILSTLPALKAGELHRIGG